MGLLRQISYILECVKISTMPFLANGERTCEIPCACCCFLSCLRAKLVERSTCFTSPNVRSATRIVLFPLPPFPSLSFPHPSSFNKPHIADIIHPYSFSSISRHSCSLIEHIDQTTKDQLADLDMSSHAASTSAGTRRIKLIKNPDFIHDGKMAYGHALRKCMHILRSRYDILAYTLAVGFKPTLEYPFEVTDDIVHSGGVVHRMNERAHGRDTHVAQRRIMATDEHGQVGEVNAQDIQQVSRSNPRTCDNLPKLLTL